MRKTTNSPTLSLLQISDQLETSRSNLSSPISNASQSPHGTQSYNLSTESIRRSQLKRVSTRSEPVRRRSKPINDELELKGCCVPVNLVFSNLCDKLSDHLLLGEQTRKIGIANQQTQPLEEQVSNTEKTEIVLLDPKFGLFSLFLWHVNGQQDQTKHSLNRLFCSHAFSLTFALPLLLFVTQWVLYIALISHEVNTFDGNFCPNKGTMETKLMMFGIGMIYFIRSFFIWDSLTVQSSIQKMNRMDNISAIMDTFQEFLFNILVYGANLILIYLEDDLQNMILNSLAMEFLMSLDNNFEEMYFANVPTAAVNIYDTMYVSRKENRRLVSRKRDQSFFYNSASCVLVLLYKLLILVIFLFPVFCLTVTIAGTYCK